MVGLAFFITLNLSLNSGHSVLPAIAPSGDNVYVVWSDDSTPGNYEILYRRSTNGGASFGSTINLSNTPVNSSTPDIAASGNNVYVVWSDDSTPVNSEILYRRSTNGGASFASITPNLSLSSGFSVLPAIAASGDNVYVVWTDGTPGNSGILYRKSTHGGASFDSTINISYSCCGGGISVDIAAINNLS